MANVVFERGIESNLPTAGLAEDGHIYVSYDNGNAYLGDSNGNLVPLNRSPYHAECSSAAATVAKEATVVDSDNFDLRIGTIVFVKFTYANTATNPTLSVNGSTAVGIVTERSWAANDIVPIIYDGSHWVAAAATVAQGVKADTIYANYLKAGNDSTIVTTPSFNPESDTVHVTPQALSSSQKGQARDNIGALASSDIKTINGESLVGSGNIDVNRYFKGWHDNVAQLQAEFPSPVKGDYAYVKGANASDPAAIYECTTAGTWSDSGRTADTSNVQTFASGEEVNEVHIVKDLTTGGANDVLNAEQGVELNQKIIELQGAVFGSSGGTEMRWVDVDMAQQSEVNVFINGNSGKWEVASGWYCIFYPVAQGSKYIITAGQGGVTRYAFMTSNSHATNTVVNTYATGYNATIRLAVGETSGELIPPTDAQYLYFLTQIGNGFTGVSLQEYIEVVIPSENGLINEVESIKEVLSEDVYEWTDAGISEADYVANCIDGTQNKWMRPLSGWSCKFIPVSPNEKYKVIAGQGGVTRYAFMTSNSHVANTVVNTYATGYSNGGVRIDAGESSTELIAPDDARYMYVLTGVGSGYTGVTVSKYEKTGEQLKDVASEIESIHDDIDKIGIQNTLIVNEGLTSSTDVYANLQDAIDSVEDGELGKILIEGDLHISNTVSIPNGKKIKLSGGNLKGSVQSLAVRRNDVNGIAKIYIGDLKPQWIEVNGVAKYPASSLRDFPYKSAVTSSGSSNATVTVTITIPVADAIKLASKSTSDVWVTLLVEWISAKLRIDSINTSTGVITCTFNQGVGSYHNWSGTKRIIVENIDIESATINGNEDTWAEGSFYYSGGYLYYKYNASESAPNIEIPAVETLISANGSLYMDGVEVSVTAHDFDNLMGEGDGHGYRSFQSGFVMNGAIEVNGQAEIRNCKFRHTTNNAIRVNSNANVVDIVNCDFNEVGCDAILVGECNYINYNKGTAQSYIPASAPSNVTIKGNSIHHPGRVYQEASAIAVAYGTDFYVGSNVISDTYYTGISTGADWAVTSTQINEGGIIEGNLLKNIGVGSCALSDGAAIYNLGNERGMVVKKNIITRIFGGKKGGQNLYAVFFDQGSKNITFSNNIVYDVYGFTSINISGSGSGISVKNNIFALPKSVVADQNENLPSCFANNIFVWSGNKTISQTTTGTYVKNLYYRYDSALSSISFDTQAVIGDPGFRDVDNYDFAVVDATYTSQAGFNLFILDAPAASLVSRTDNTKEDATSLSEWIEAWENGNL